MIELGAIVEPTDDNWLCSGSSTYPCAVVACLDPFLLVSEQTDMCWSTRTPDKMRVIGTAKPYAINAAQRRVPAPNQVRVPCGESFLSNELGCGLTLIHIGTRPTAIDLNETNKPWDGMGGWKDEIASKPNPSYGYTFEYDADAQLWRSARQVSTQELFRITQMAKAGFVTTGLEASSDQVKFVFANPEPITATELGALVPR